MRIISQEGFCYQDIPYERSAFYMSTYEDPILSIWVDREISMYNSYGDILEWLKQPVED